MTTWGDCRNCAVNCIISGPELKYQDQNVSIIKWWLWTGTWHVLQENPGMWHVLREIPGLVPRESAVASKYFCDNNYDDNYQETNRCGPSLTRLPKPATYNTTIPTSYANRLIFYRLWGFLWGHPCHHTAHSLYTLRPGILIWLRGELSYHQEALGWWFRVKKHFPLMKYFMNKSV